MSDIGVGSSVWVFDPNSRGYDSEGRKRHRAHWVECRIVNETSRSWVLDRYGKVPKKADERGRRLISQGRFSPLLAALTLQEVEDDCWQHEHRRHIVEAVNGCDLATLRRVAELVGYGTGERE